MTTTVQRIPAMPKSKTKKQEGSFNARQLCFFSAFIAPLSKFLETPSLLSQYALGDLLLPTILQYLLQSSALAVLLFIIAKTRKGFFTLVNEKLGNIGAKIFYAVLSAYFLFSSLLPMIELEKFSQAVFFDTAPFAFTFTPFFFLSGFICVKGLKSFARIADIGFPLFILSFFGIIFMSVGETDFESILPWFEFPIPKILNAVKFTTSHFSDAILFLPLLGDYRYEQGDGKKIYFSYWAGGVFVLLFLAIFYGIYTTIAPAQHYAFTKIAQYFPALKTVGRIDLIFVYLLTVILFFVNILPVRLCVLCLEKTTDCKNKIVLSAIVNAGLFLFVFFFNKYQNTVFELVTKTLWWVFPVFSVLLPFLCLLLLLGNKKPKNRTRKNTVKEKNYAR